MSIATYLPRIGLLERAARRSRHPQHRAVDAVERQLILRAGADLLIKGLRQQLDEQEARHPEVIARIDERHAETVRGLENQIAELERHLQVRVLAEAAAAKTQELDVRALRDNYAARVRTLPQAHCIGPVTDPGRVHGEGVA